MLIAQGMAGKGLGHNLYTKIDNFPFSLHLCTSLLSVYGCQCSLFWGFLLEREVLVKQHSS